MEQVARRVTIADVAERAGVSKTAVSFAFNNPDRLNAATATRILDIAQRARLPAGSGRPDADPAADRRDRRADPAGPVGRSSPTRSSGRSARGSPRVAEERGYGLHFISPLHGSLSRAIHRATVDGVVAIGLTDDHPGDRRDPAGRPADGPRRLGHDRRSGLGRRRRRGRRPAGRGAPLELGHRDIAILAIDGPRAAPRATARRRRAPAARLPRRRSPRPGIELAADAIAVGPASIDGGREAFDRLLGRRAAGRRRSWR